MADWTPPSQGRVEGSFKGRHGFLFTATPICLVGSTGAPAHPPAIF